MRYVSVPRWVVVLATAVSAVLVLGGLATAVTTTINACADKRTGSLRLLVSGACTTKENAVSWNSAGVQGSPGPVGPSGPPGPSGSGSSLSVVDKDANVYPMVFTYDVGIAVIEISGVLWNLDLSTGELSAVNGISIGYRDVGCLNPFFYGSGKYGLDGMTYGYSDWQHTGVVADAAGATRTPVADGTVIYMTEDSGSSWVCSGVTVGSANADYSWPLYEVSTETVQVPSPLVGPFTIGTGPQATPSPSPSASPTVVIP